MAKVKAAKKPAAQKMRASTEAEKNVESDAEAVDMTGVESDEEVQSAQPATPKQKPKSTPKKAKRSPANGVQKAKKATAKPKPKANAKPKTKKKDSGPSTADMVHNALSSMKDRKGISMAAIRNFIANNYNREAKGTFLYRIRKYMENEFLADRLRMTNSDEKSINFAKRFALMK